MGLVGIFIVAVPVIVVIILKRNTKDSLEVQRGGEREERQTDLVCRLEPSMQSFSGDRRLSLVLKKNTAFREAMMKKEKQEKNTRERASCNAIRVIQTSLFFVSWSQGLSSVVSTF